MKIQIKNLEANPYRDMNNYPIDQIKVNSLTDSINQTGFWDNILARKSNGKYQIAYGHHRLIALRGAMKPTDEVDIPVKELSDALMIKIMAKENDDDWKTTPKIIDETVRVTKKFLEENSEEVKKMGFRSAIAERIGAVIIAKFLDWDEWKVSNSLERIGLIENKIIDKEAIERLPTDYSARTFIKAVKKMDLPLNKQNAAVDKILDTKRSERDIEDAVIGEKYTAPKKKQEYKNEQLKSFENFIGELRNDSDDLYEKLRKFARLEKEIGEYDKNVYRKLLDLSLSTLSKQIDLIIKNNKNEKGEFTNSNPASITG
jgi:ParB-like chromosome segregation protein Spo0J